MNFIKRLVGFKEVQPEKKVKLELSAQPNHWRHKLNCLEIALDFVVANNVIGDYLEFGVFRGKSFAHAYKFYTERFSGYKKLKEIFAEDPFLNQQTKFFAFDSFEGLPQDNDTDIPLHWIGSDTMKCDKNTFVKSLQEYGVDLSAVNIIEGFYENSLCDSLFDTFNLKQAAVIHIDCDLYSSTKTVLNFITPLIADGTVFVFDDFFYYKGHPSKGERGAFNEWLNENRQFSATELCKYYPAAAYIINKL
jgi:hypothetical protein